MQQQLKMANFQSSVRDDECSRGSLVVFNGTPGMNLAGPGAV